VDASTPEGTWYLLANGFRLELSLQLLNNVWSGTIKNEGGPVEALDQITWDATGRWLEFRRNGPGFFQWYRMSLTYGVVAGRFSHVAAAPKPGLTSYTGHVTGWSPTWLDTDLVLMTWNLTINTNFKAVLRLDRDSTRVLRGRLKVFGPTEELEHDLRSITWNGTNLRFTRQTPNITQVFTGVASGRFISGFFTHNGGSPAPWDGARAEVLGFGLGSRLSKRGQWQTATRARVVNLTEGMRIPGVGIPAVSVTAQPTQQLLSTFPGERDDDPTSWPPNYSLQKLTFSVSPGSRFDPTNPPPPRTFEGYLATPMSAVPPGGFRAVVVVNGHGGSAQQCIVLAVDIGHRPKWGLPGVMHSPIVDSGYPDSNWEEDGERSFSLRRAIDWLLSQPNVRNDRLFMWGHSLGGEVTTITSGLDPRIALSIVCGFSPDMHFMDINGNHFCYRWENADIHEYLDVSDWEALTAPRHLVVETGQGDFTFSGRHPPFAGDKQLVRRARAAYGADSAKLIHYLHYDGHHPHVGDANPTHPSRQRNVLAAAVTDPIADGDQTWQSDATTTVRSPSLYALMNQILP
jgi:hypothetical protein